MKKVLVIEDHESMRENISEILQMAGYSCIVTDNGDDGIDICIRDSPDIILCDIFMPGTNGYTVFSSIRKNPHTAHIPFVFITGDTSSSGKCRGLNAGVDDYLVKPFDHKELLAIVKRRIYTGHSLPGKLEEKELNYIQSLEKILGTISHEMRNPICSSIGLATLLDKQKISESELKTIIDGLKSNASMLDGITGDLTEVIYKTIQQYKANQ